MFEKNSQESGMMNLTTLTLSYIFPPRFVNVLSHMSGIIDLGAYT